MRWPTTPSFLHLLSFTDWCWSGSFFLFLLFLVQCFQRTVKFWSSNHGNCWRKTQQPMLSSFSPSKICRPCTYLQDLDKRMMHWIMLQKSSWWGWVLSFCNNKSIAHGFWSGTGFFGIAADCAQHFWDCTSSQGLFSFCQKLHSSLRAECKAETACHSCLQDGMLPNSEDLIV